MRAAKAYGLVVLVLGAVLLGMPTQAGANIGLPMLAVAWPIAWNGFFPVFFLEAWIWRKHLRKSMNDMLGLSFKANLLTTLLGMPITWFLLCLYEFGVIRLLQHYEGSVHAYQALKHFPYGHIAGIFVSFPWMGPMGLLRPWRLVGFSLLSIFIAVSLLFLFFFIMSWWVEYLFARSKYEDIPKRELRRAAFRANVWSYVMLLVGTVFYYSYIFDWHL